jgi:hypothetical protein
MTILYKLRAYVDFDASATGMGGAGIRTLEANNPAMESGQTAGAGGIAQSLRLQQAEQIFTIAGGALTSAEVQAALTQLGVDLLAQVNSVNTSTGTTPLAQMIGWASGAE